MGKIPVTPQGREVLTTDEVLQSRLIDRCVRPLLSSEVTFDSQIIAMAHADDGKANVDIMAINGASLALLLSDAPWEGWS